MRPDATGSGPSPCFPTSASASTSTSTELNPFEHDIQTPTPRGVPRGWTGPLGIVGVVIGCCLSPHHHGTVLSASSDRACWAASQAGKAPTQPMPRLHAERDPTPARQARGSTRGSGGGESCVAHPHPHPDPDHRTRLGGVERRGRSATRVIGSLQPRPLSSLRRSHTHGATRCEPLAHAARTPRYPPRRRCNRPPRRGHQTQVRRRQTSARH